MRFVKMHGLGNDYVYVDGRTERIADPARVAVAISDRHRGVGSDGLILVLPPEPGVDADVRMRMFNADGLEAEMCGNGVRCVCKFAYERGISRRQPMRVQTGRGVLTLSFVTDDEGQVAHVTVDMGTPILDPPSIPVLVDGPGPVLDRPWGPLAEAMTVAGDPDWPARAGADGKFSALSMGPPHAIFYCRDVDAVPLGIIGPRIERHPLFPRRINVNFVQIVSRGHIKMRTFERGSGITLACGTGASAVCVAGVLTGRTERRITSKLLGGDLQLEWDEATNHVYMTGPATEVFTGDWPDA